MIRKYENDFIVKKAISDSDYVEFRKPLEMTCKHDTWTLNMLVGLAGCCGVVYPERSETGCLWCNLSDGQVWECGGKKYVVKFIGSEPGTDHGFVEWARSLEEPEFNPDDEMDIL